MPSPVIDLSTIPADTALPMSAARPSPFDVLKMYEKRLTTPQRVLLEAFRALNYSRQAQLTQGARPEDSIPYMKIKLLYEEQIRENARGADADALKDTTRSTMN